MYDTNDYMKKMRLPGDARSTRGILSRGRNVYRGGSPSAKTGSLQKASLQKLRNMQK